MTDNLKGRCLCGEVKFELEPPFREVVVCHCTQCAQWTGHQVAATAVSPDRWNVIDGEDRLQWYRSSDYALRGFCKTCGSNLFWRRTDKNHISIMAGAIDDPSGLEIGAHIFTKDQRDYVKTDAAAPRFNRLSPETEESS